MATTVDLGKVRPVWKGTWSGSTAYEVHDMVKSGLDSYICTTGHTSSGTFSNDSANWDTLATGFSGDAADITSGTIPDARFPATLPAIDGSNLTGVDGGKLLQVVNNNDTNISSFSSPSNNSWAGTVVVASITPQSSTSRMVVFVNFGVNSYNTSTDYGYGVRMARTINGNTTYPTSLNWQFGTNVHSLIYEGGTSGEDNSHKSFHLSGYDSTHSTTSAIEYNLQSAAYDVNSYSVGGPYGHRWNLTIMEIEQ